MTELLDAADPRPLMEFDESFITEGRCTYCHNGQKVKIWVTKHHHELHPLGHLNSRCEMHQEYYRSVW